MRTLLLLVCCLSLAGCGAITRGLSDLQKGESYPSAKTNIKALLYTPPQVNLAYYQSPQSRPHQRSDLAIALAASGGGYRAANLTAGVLLGLEKIRSPLLNGNLLEEVDYISSVSGGGFAIGLFLSSEFRYLTQHPKGRFSFTKAFLSGKSPLKSNLRIDYSDELFFGYQRSLDLEAQLGKNLLSVNGERQLVLGDIFIANNSKKRIKQPLWVTNSTILQNNNLFQFVPAVLKQYKVAGYLHDYKKHQVHNRPNEVYGYSIPFAVGMTASATFPYAVAGTTLLSKACDEACYLQLFDGGLVDNLGVFSAMEMLRQDKAKYKVLIVVDAFSANPEPFSQNKEPPGKLDLLKKVMESAPNSFQRQMHEFIPIAAKNILCTGNTEQVLVAYLDIYHSPEAQKVPTSLWISEASQDLLIKTGMTLVQDNKVLTKDITRMLKGVRVADCHART